MSAAQHEHEASSTDETAAAHADQYDAKARADAQACKENGALSRSGTAPVCWTSTANPTEEHRREAETYRTLAAQHRAAAAELRAAEENACGGIAAEDRDVSPFFHREDIVSVEPLMNQGYYASHSGRGGPKVMTGARVTFRAVRGLTAQWLQRVVNCHLARNATLGHHEADMPDCPLVPRGVSASVVSTAEGFEVDIKATDRTTAEDVLTRAKALVPAAPSHAAR